MQNRRRIILVGKTGNGKSSTGNSLLQRNAFIHRLSINAVTETSVMERRYDYANNMFYDVVDTPGLFDTERNVSERALEIQRSVEICQEPHAFLIVFSVVNRMTVDERFTIDILRIMFGEGIFDHSIVVFTHGNMLQSDQEFQQFCRGNQVLVNLINRCRNRVVKIDNNIAFSSNNEGTQRIFQMIENISDAGNRVYRYNGLNIHRSVIEEHLRNFHGNGDINEELIEIAIRIEEETRRIEEEMRNRRIRNTILAGAGGVAGCLAVGAVGVFAGPGLVAAASSRMVTSCVVAAAGGATIKVATDVVSRLRF